MNAETWLPVVGFDGEYEVSDHGRIRHVPRIVSAWTPSMPGGNELRRIGRRLSERGSLDGRGYRVASLTHPGSGRRRQLKVHTLVLEAFTGPRPAGMWGLHRNGNREDNRIENLYWGTPKQNADDRVRHGRHWNATKTHCPLAHPLVDGNLMPDRKGARRCLACNRARGHKKRLGASLTPAVRQQIADWYFAHPDVRWPGDEVAGIVF